MARNRYNYFFCTFRNQELAFVLLDAVVARLELFTFGIFDGICYFPFAYIGDTSSCPDVGYFAFYKTFPRYRYFRLRKRGPVIRLASAFTCQHYTSRADRQASVLYGKLYIRKVLIRIPELPCCQAHLIGTCIGSRCFCCSAECEVICCVQRIADGHIIALCLVLFPVVKFCSLMASDYYRNLLGGGCDRQLAVRSPRYDILFSFINGSDCSFSKCCRILASVCSLCTHLDSREICSLRCSDKSAYALLLPIIDLRIAVCCQSYVLIVIECNRFILRIYYHFLAARIYRRISLNCNWAFRYCFVIRLIRNNLILCCVFCCAVPVIMNRIPIIVPDLPDCIKHIHCFIRMNDHIRTCCIFCSCCIRFCAPSDKLITGTGKDFFFRFYLLVILKSGYHYLCFTITGCSTVSVIGQ